MVTRLSATVEESVSVLGQRLHTLLTILLTSAATTLISPEALTSLDPPAVLSLTERKSGESKDRILEAGEGYRTGEAVETLDE